MNSIKFASYSSEANMLYFQAIHIMYGYPGFQAFGQPEQPRYPLFDFSVSIEK
jgi:hypothetical protein